MLCVLVNHMKCVHNELIKYHQYDNKKQRQNTIENKDKPMANIKILHEISLQPTNVYKLMIK